MDVLTIALILLTWLPLAAYLWHLEKNAAAADDADFVNDCINRELYQ